MAEHALNEAFENAYCGQKSSDEKESQQSFDARVSTLFTSLTTFGVHTELLVGAPLATILRNGGSVFRSSDRSKRANRFAVKVIKLDFFVSHNWVVPRIPKFIALIFFFNTSHALVVSCSVTVVYLCWESFSSQPVAYRSVLLNREVGFLCRLLFVPLFLAVTVFIRPFLAALRVKRPILFVDKACIRQDDPKEMSLGLHKLPAFLNHSSEMVILYTDVYLTRLWTVYEIASFLALHPIRRLRVVPVVLPIVFYSCLILGWLGGVWSIIVHAYGFPQISVNVFRALSGGIYACILRKWVREKDRIKQRLANFEVRDVSCEVDGDRPLILERIAALLQVAGLSPFGCTLDESLDAFNITLRKDLPKAFDVLLANVSFDYTRMVLLGACFAGTNGLDRVFVNLDENTPQEGLTETSYFLLWTLIYYPVLSVVMEIFVSYNLHLAGIKDVAWVLFVYLFIAAIGLGVDYGIRQLMERAYLSDACLSAFVGMAAAQMLIGGVCLSYFFRKLYCCLKSHAHNDGGRDSCLYGGVASLSRCSSDTDRGEGNEDTTAETFVF